MTQWHRYKVTGTVKFFVDDLVTETEEEAKQHVQEALDEDLEAAFLKGNIQILELNAEELCPCDPERFFYGDGEC